MQKITHSITINASTQTVWAVMFSKSSYSKRTSAFNPHGSWFEWNREQWSEIKFLWPNPESPEDIWWMYSKVTSNILFQELCLIHQWEIIGWEKIPNSDRTDATENYYLSEQDWITTLTVSQDIVTEYVDFMNDVWPKALGLIKQLSEENTSSTSRVFDATLDTVHQAWSNPEKLKTWRWPNGFTNTFETFDRRIGGEWKFVMHGPDWQNYINESTFTSIEKHQIEIFHVTQPQFHLVAIFQIISDKQTLVSFNQIFESAEVFAWLKNFIAGKNEENLDRLWGVLWQ